jgi:hypothetical protein
LKLLTALSVILVIIASNTTSVAAEPRVIVCPDAREGVQFYKLKTWEMQHFLGLRRTQSANHERWTRSCKYIRWIANTWRKRYVQIKKQYQRPPHYDAWMCIHHYEGAWNDPNAPFWGGLQMDEGFQKAYGIELYRSKGTADKWTPLEQMWVAERAYVTRGFYPWPNTARYCGLI